MFPVVGTPFFKPKNVGFFNSKLKQAADMSRTVNCLHPNAFTNL